ncbi:hypothetical protein ABZS86_19640 [Streptomyces sp. NPDC005355]|uniref:hypothetical protein n=1 Tax=Streptomyces sp. NPDC005355 TaxID=3157038 RepID=UPI0033B7ED78
MARGATEDVVLRQLPWFTSSVRLWAAWHRIDLRPLETLFDSLPALPGGPGASPEWPRRAAAPSRG